MLGPANDHPHMVSHVSGHNQLKRRGPFVIRSPNIAITFVVPGGHKVVGAAVVGHDATEISPWPSPPHVSQLTCDGASRAS